MFDRSNIGSTEVISTDAFSSVGINANTWCAIVIVIMKFERVIDFLDELVAYLFDGAFGALKIFS